MAASDAIAFEQPFIQDVQRASCIQLPGQPPVLRRLRRGDVPFHQQAQCSGRSTLLCLEWPDLVSSGQCDMALYALSTNPVSRSAWEGSTETSTSFSGVTVQILSTSGSQPAGLDVRGYQ